tara:strand:- start:14539 stop:14907 length:369 start_codon:yes stop_codon:yes gene_type:complete
MSTLTVGLTLTHPAGDIATDPLAMSLTDNLTVTTPNNGVSRLTALTASPTEILTIAAAATTYVYLKNTDSTNIVVVQTAGAVSYLDLNPDEFAFLPLKGAVGLSVQAAGGDCVLEYGFWTKG